MNDYKELFRSFKKSISTDEDVMTPQITSKIKAFFVDEFSDYFVAPRSGVKEFLVDIFVSNIDPRSIHKSPDKGLESILAVESELGGNGGGAPGVLKCNVVEDFAKLLVIQSQLKVMIFTTLPFSKEENHVYARINELYNLFELSECKENILLIHLDSTHQITEKRHPTNPKVNINEGSISGFLLLKAGGVQKIT